MRRTQLELRVGDSVKITAPIVVEGWLRRREIRTELIVELVNIDVPGETALVAIVAPEAGDAA